jgi:hypothetical protein
MDWFTSISYGRGSVGPCPAIEICICILADSQEAKEDIKRQGELAVQANVKWYLLQHTVITI